MNDFHGTKIGRQTVDCVEMLDKGTCILSFKPKKENESGSKLRVTVAEYWLDENKWIFQDQYFEDDMYVDSCESQCLCGYEMLACKKVVREFLKQNNK